MRRRGCISASRPGSSNAVAVRDAGGHPARALPAQPARRPGRRSRAHAGRAGGDGADRGHHRGAGTGRRGADRRARRRAGPAAPWFAAWASEQAQAALPPDADATVRTTLDPRLQAVAEGQARGAAGRAGCRGQRRAGRRGGDGRGQRRGARDGRRAGLAGIGPFNRAVLARRQPGSSFKLFVWLAALEKGATPGRHGSTDGPIRLGRYSPSNFEPGFHGEVIGGGRARAVAQHRLGAAAGAGGRSAVRWRRWRAGWASRTRLPDDASLALGTGEVGRAGDGGRLCHGVQRRHTRWCRPQSSPRNPATGRFRCRVRRRCGWLPTEQDAMMVRMLAAVVARGTGRAAAVPGRVVAGKTGTTQDYRDAWFIGVRRARGDRGVAGQRRQPADARRHRRQPAGAAVP